MAVHFPRSMLLPPPTPMITSGLNWRAASADASMVFRSTSGRPSGKMSTSHPPSFSKASTRSAIPLLIMLRSVQTIARLPSSWPTLRSSSNTPQPKNTRPAEEKPQCRLLADCGTELLCGMPNLLWMWNPTHESLFPKLILGIAWDHDLLKSLPRP